MPKRFVARVAMLAFPLHKSESWRQMTIERIILFIVLGLPLLAGVGLIGDAIRRAIREARQTEQ